MTMTLSKREVELQLVLHHEAAHMSACMMFEIPFDIAVVTTGFWGGLRGGVHVTEGVDPTKIENEIIMYLVGLAAERRWLELHPGYGSVNESNGASDTHEAKILLRLYRSKISGENHLRRRADRFVENRWEHIRLVAAKLGERRRLTAHQAKKVS